MADEWPTMITIDMTRDPELVAVMAEIDRYFNWRYQWSVFWDWLGVHVVVRSIYPDARWKDE